MSDLPPSNAKIYARPEKKMPSPVMLAIGVILLLIVGIFAYRFFVPSAPTAIKTKAGLRLQGERRSPLEQQQEAGWTSIAKSNERVWIVQTV